MAYYKKGNMYLDEDESVGHSACLWGACLFVLGAYFVGNYVHGILPEGLPKELRFVSVILSAGGAGSILAHFSIQICAFFCVALAYGAFAGFLYWVWTWV